MTWKTKTAGGYLVRIYAEDGLPPFSIHGAVWDDGEQGQANIDGWHAHTWNEDGSVNKNIQSPYDLVAE